MIFLARHGETQHNAQLRFQGQGDVPLNATGREQAHALAELVAERSPVALYASPILRARETAEIVAQRIGLAPRFDARFAEHDVGDWRGRLFADIQRDDPAGWAAWQAGGADWRFPGGESLGEQQERVLDGLAEVREAGELPAVVICHRGVMRSVLCHQRGEPLTRFHTIQVANGTLLAL